VTVTFDSAPILVAAAPPETAPDENEQKTDEFIDADTDDDAAPDSMDATETPTEDGSVELQSAEVTSEIDTSPPEYAGIEVTILNPIMTEVLII